MGDMLPKSSDSDVSLSASKQKSEMIRKRDLGLPRQLMKGDRVGLPMSWIMGIVELWGLHSFFPFQEHESLSFCCWTLANCHNYYPVTALMYHDNSGSQVFSRKLSDTWMSTNIFLSWIFSYQVVLQTFSDMVLQCAC